MLKNCEKVQNNNNRYAHYQQYAPHTFSLDFGMVRQVPDFYGGIS